MSIIANGSRSALRSVALVFAATTVALPLLAQALPVGLTYVPGSSVKLEQVTGDCDLAVLAATKSCKPTASQTVSRFNIAGQSLGFSFEDQGKMLFFFGDTIGASPFVVDYNTADMFATSTTTNGEDPLFITYVSNSNGSPMFVQPIRSNGSRVSMGIDDVPSAGINLGGQVYVVVTTAYDGTIDTNISDWHLLEYSVLTRLDEAAKTFTAGRTISDIGGHFITTSLYELPAQFVVPQLGPGVVMYGVGKYRASDVFLSYIPTDTFWSGLGTVWYAGMLNGKPVWSNSEAGAVPVVLDNSYPGAPSWPHDDPTIGNVSVTYSPDLNLWLMTYDGGRNDPQTTGIYFTYAMQPWGPWAKPQLIFNGARDHGDGVFIYAPNLSPAGPSGPTRDGVNPITTPGAAFAPQLISRFTKVTGNTLNIYYTMSTLNPYAVVKMRSSFTITLPRGRAAKH